MVGWGPNETAVPHFGHLRPVMDHKPIVFMISLRTSLACCSEQTRTSKTWPHPRHLIKCFKSGTSVPSTASQRLLDCINMLPGLGDLVLPTQRQIDGAGLFIMPECIAKQAGLSIHVTQEC